MKQFAIAVVLLAAFYNTAGAQNVTIIDRPTQSPVIVTSDTLVENIAPMWRVSIKAGASYYPIKYDGDSMMREYYKGLKWGVNLGADVTYFMARNWGIGAKFNDAHFANSATGTVYYNSGESKSGVIADDINVYYAGPSVSYRWLSSNNMYSFLFYYSLGYMGFYDKSKVVDPLDMKGATLGYALGLDFDLGITKHIAFGLGADVVSGSLSSYSATMNGMTQKVTMEKGQVMGISHIDLTAGLRFLF